MALKQTKGPKGLFARKLKPSNFKIICDVFNHHAERTRKMDNLDIGDRRPICYANTTSWHANAKICKVYPEDLNFSLVQNMDANIQRTSDKIQTEGVPTCFYWLVFISLFSSYACA